MENILSDDIVNSLICFLCKNIYSLDVLQTDCGHRFCRTCIEKRLDLDKRECPYRDEDCINDIKKLYPDVATKREVLKYLNSNMLCPNKIYGCDICLPTKDINRHLKVCEKDPNKKSRLEEDMNLLKEFFEIKMIKLDKKIEDIDKKLNDIIKENKLKMVSLTERILKLEEKK